MIAQNLLTAEETRDYREQGIQDRLEVCNVTVLTVNVAIAPTVPLDPLEPAQLSGPSSTGMGLGILNAGLGMASGIMNAFPQVLGQTQEHLTSN